MNAVFWWFPYVCGVLWGGLVFPMGVKCCVLAREDHVLIVSTPVMHGKNECCFEVRSLRCVLVCCRVMLSHAVRTTAVLSAWHAACELPSVSNSFATRATLLSRGISPRGRFAPEMDLVRHAIDFSQRDVEGTVEVALYKVRRLGLLVVP